MNLIAETQFTCFGVFRIKREIIFRQEQKIFKCLLPNYINSPLKVHKFCINWYRIFFMRVIFIYLFIFAHFWIHFYLVSKNVFQKIWRMRFFFSMKFRNHCFIVNFLLRKISYRIEIIKPLWATKNNNVFSSA